jgi:hypothetical protein
MALGTFVNENLPDNVEPLPQFLQSAWPRGRAVFVTSIEDLESRGIDLISIRNAPIEINFTESYWESN